jgi:integrase
MENQKRKITKTMVAEAAPRGKEYVIWDTVVPGFGLRVRPSGATSFIFMYRTAGGRSGSTKRITINAHTPDVAREEAKKLSGQSLGGADPAGDKAEAKREAERQKLAPDVAAILGRFIEEYVHKELKKKTADEYERIINKHIKQHVGSMRIEELSQKHVAAMYDAMRERPTQAAMAVRILSSAMSWAGERGYRSDGVNPASIRLSGTRRRERLFTDTEVSRLLSTLDTLEADGRVLPEVARGLRLLFATGCRAGEISDLVWDNVDLDEGVMRWGDSKTGYLEKPITDEARAILGEAAKQRRVGVPWVCPSPSNRRLRLETLEAGFERVMRVAKVKADENATLHLIRHWFATKTYTNKSIPLALQMAIVGHKSVATAMRYTHVSREELRQAAAEAAHHRAGLIKAAEKRGEVVQLRQGQ